jgi:hypothetical protein
MVMVMVVMVMVMMLMVLMVMRHKMPIMIGMNEEVQADKKHQQTQHRQQPTAVAAALLQACTSSASGASPSLKSSCEISESGSSCDE